ncbi:hypothetical protein AAF712_006038 [Marasmius tenuissimus]|uniref:HMG domain-containing protein n=1 Tax=Marasmius tenuissimus TaxID=585030 RepID=A0ABR3A1E0_9AGAR
MRVGEDVRITCKCPEGDRCGKCVHSETYLEFRDEDFRAVEEKMFRDGHVVWFWHERENREPAEGLLWTNRFSVGHAKDGINGRAMVVYSGSDAGDGVWSCSKCSGTCTHTSAAKGFFKQVLGLDDAEERDGDDMVSDDEENVLMFEDGNNVNVVRQEETGISYLPIRPPEWAELPGDVVHYSRPPRNNDLPTRIPLGESNRTACGRGPSTIADHLRIIKTCTVYMLTEKLTVEIELAPTALFTHELLDEYTSRYTSCETPFVVFVEAMGRVYRGRGCTFVKEDMFRSVWFAYVSIQDFSRDMYCQQCGTNPDCLIWDGVTLGFGRKHLSDSLKPPTHTDKSSPIRQRTRKAGGDSDEERDAAKDSGSFDLILRRLILVSQELATLFKRTFCPNAQIEMKLKRLYGNLFEQIAAKESVLQMIAPRAIDELKDFVACPDWHMASRLVNTPALYNVLEGEMKVNGKYPKDLINACRWMHTRAAEVLAQVTAKDVGPLGEETIEDLDNWKVVSESSGDDKFCC